jgi:hypothetical protein
MRRPEICLLESDGSRKARLLRRQFSLEFECGVSAYQNIPFVEVETSSVTGITTTRCVIA